MGLPGTPVTRATRPPAAGPMLRYLSALNSFGDSGLVVFVVVGASCAPTDITSNAHAAAVRNESFLPDNMRASLSSANDPFGRVGPRVRRAAVLVPDRHVGVRLRDGALPQRACLDARRDERRPPRGVVRRDPRACTGR